MSVVSNICMNIDYCSRPGTDLLDPYGAIAMLAEIIECTANCYLLSAPDAHQTKECFAELFLLNRSDLNPFVAGTAFCGEMTVCRGFHCISSSADGNSLPE